MTGSDMTGSASPPPAPPASPPRESSYSRDRILAFSDGVFAIAITLLVLEIVPHIAGAVAGPQFARALLDLAPELVAYFLSFLVIGRFWDTHRVFFRFIAVGDARVSWLNLLILLWITLIPATAGLLGSHWQEPAALTLYALNLLLAIASYWLLWRYVSSAQYVREEGLAAASQLHLDRYVGVSALGYALAIPAAFLSPFLALALIFLTTAVARTVARRALTPSAASSLQGQDATRGDDV
jgi:uncharacterized membrane protein